MGNKISPTTFYEYCQEGNLAAVQTILSQVSPCVKEKLFAHRVEEMPMLSTPLFTAIQHHHLPVVQLLLDYGINPNSQIKTFGRSSSETALMHAISWRNAMIVDVLLRYRADSERPDAHGKTALHKACALRDSSLKDMSSIVEIVDVLLKHRADLDAVDKSGNLPLHWACVSGNLPVVEFLLAEHGDITLRQLDRPNKMAKTPLMIACEYNHVSLTQLLLTQGANPFLALSVLVAAAAPSTSTKATPPKAHKKTALCWAVENGHTEIVHLLLAHHRAMVVVDCPAVSTVDTATTSTTVAYETLPSLGGGAQSTLRQRCTPTSSGSARHTKDKEVTWLLDLSGDGPSQGGDGDGDGDGYTDTASVSTATTRGGGGGVGSVAWRKKMDFAYTSNDDDVDVDGDDYGDHSSHDDGGGGAMEDAADDMRNSINHLVGCCLLEAILLGHVAIAQALLDHVEFYRHAQQRHTQHTGVVKGWETMYARGLSIACRKQRRDMVAMMLRHGQTVGVFASSPLDRWGSVSLSTDEDSTEDSSTNVEEIFRTLSQQARDDPIITALLQQYLLPPASSAH